MVSRLESLYRQRQRLFYEFAQEHPTLASAGPASLVSTIASFPVGAMADPV